MQAANCNEQVPAKLYEYLRARRPLLALTDRNGDTASLMLQSGIDAIASLVDAAEIAQLLQRFADGDSSGMRATEAAVAGASRHGRTRQLALLLDSVADPATEREPASPDDDRAASGI
jgi:hypothetical protein